MSSTSAMRGELDERMTLLYAAVGEVTEEADISKLPIEITTLADGTQAIGVDFSAGMSEAQLQLRAQAAVNNVAHLRDHLRRWAKAKGFEPGVVNAAVDACQELKIVIDLANNDKHGYPPRGSGLSGVTPRLGSVERFMLMSPDMTTGISFAEGQPKVIGTSPAPVVISGPVIDASGNVIGRLHEILQKATDRLEQIARELGLIP